MTTPYASPPDGAYVIGDESQWGQGLTEAEVIARISGQAELNYNAAAGEWGGTYDELIQLSNAVEEGQLELGGRVDLLEAVAGYGSCFMGKNWEIPGSTIYTLPFDTQLGPSKDVLFEQNGIKVLTKGLWRADAMVTLFPPPPNWFSGASAVGVTFYLSVYSADGAALYSEKQHNAVANSYGAESASWSHTFVVPEDDEYVVKVRMGHPQSSAAKVYGGTMRSALSVNKWDVGTANAVVAPTVPDGGTLS